jgi:DNA phosphorothioation-associated putative methyltransferase
LGDESARREFVELAEYKKALAEIPYGKRLPSALYLFSEPGQILAEPIHSLLERAKLAFAIPGESNVIKLRIDELKISFLSYPDFFSDPHPALRHAVTIDLVRGKARHTDYAKNPNPPILHRKETFLPPGHPKRAEFEALTRAEEAAGLYEHTATIGFKLNWEKLLKEKGLVITGHALEKAEGKGLKAEVKWGTKRLRDYGLQDHWGKAERLTAEMEAGLP